MIAERLVHSIADVEAIETQPISHLNLPQSTYHAIRDAAAKYPNRVAFKNLLTGSAEEEPQILLYQDLIAKIHQTANLLHELHVGPDDAVTLLLPIIPETSICLWAAAANGIANPVNSFLETEHLVAIIRSAKAKVVIGCHPSIEATSWSRVQAIQEKIPNLILIQIGGDIEDLAPGIIHFESSIAKQPDNHLVSGREPHAEDICAYLHTGGTTGAPKLARHHHQGQLLQCVGMDFLLGRQDPSTGLLGIPMFHVGGAVVSSLYSLSRGGTIVTLHPNGLRDPITVRDFLKNAARFNATALGGVPASWAALLTQPSDHLDLNKVRYGIVGASTLPLEVANGVTAKFGFPLIEGWGMTETHGFATMNPLHAENRVGSVGLRFPYMEIKIVQLDKNGRTSRLCNIDEIGTILVKGPQVIKGYVDDAHDHDAWVDNGWLNTGDLARMDKDGYIWHTGRSKDLIIRGGHNIDPVLIEEILYQAPGIELAAAVGQPDRRVGEVPVAFVQMQPDNIFNEEIIKEFVRERIQERAANPVVVYLLDEMPLTQVGKIFKPELRILAARTHLQKELSFVARDRGQVEVSVKPHLKYGTLATISITGGDENLLHIIKDLVDGYSLRTEIIQS